MAAKTLSSVVVTVKTQKLLLCGRQLSILPVRYKRGITLDISKWNGEKFVSERKHQETQQFPGQYTGEPPPLGKIYDKKPFKFEVEAGKVYSWCSCGNSKNQPFCDGSHRWQEGTSEKKTRPRFRPVKYKAEETKTVYFCNCKQTKNRPFCDNTHKKPEIADAITVFRN